MTALCLAEVAQLVEGQLHGVAEQIITGIASLANAKPHQISFLSQLRYLQLCRKSLAGALLVPQHFPNLQVSQIVCRNPYLAAAKMALHFHPQTLPPAGIAASADVHPSATIDASTCVQAHVSIGANVVVGAGCWLAPGVVLEEGVILGDNVHLHANVCVMRGCVLGNRVVVHAGSVIGSDGFGYALDPKSSKRLKIPQIGIVVVEDDVEIGANVTIDRATFDTTCIGEGSKIDNLVQIGHNVSIGKHCIVVSQSGIAGSSRLGDEVVMGAQTGVVGHVDVASGTMLAARAALSHSTRRKGIYCGSPAVPRDEWLKQTVLLRRLPQLYEWYRQFIKPKP